MRRIITTIILLLLLGATTTIAVAWAYVLELIPGEYVKVQDYTYDNNYVVIDHRNAGFYSHLVYHKNFYRLSDQVTDHGDLPSWCSTENNIQSDLPRYFEEASGWPCFCFKSISHEVYSIGTNANALVDSGIRIGKLKAEDSFRVLEPWDGQPVGGPFQLDLLLLPVKIMWPGFITNTFFWSLLWFTLIPLITALRWMRLHFRSTRQMCGLCGYSLQHIDSRRCPECGWNRFERPPLSSTWINYVLSLSLIVLILILAAMAQTGVSKRVGPERIHVAALEGDVKTIQNELARGISIDLPVITGDGSIQGTTPVMWAVFGSQTETLTYLIEQGANLEAINANRLKAIHFAAQQNTTAMVRLLVEGGADINAKNSLDSTPLNLATYSPYYTEVAYYLIDQNPELNMIDQRYRTPLISAIRHQNMDLSKTLIEHGSLVELEEAEHQPIEWAVRATPEFVQLLIDSGYDLSQSKTNLMHAAVGNTNSVEMIAFLLEHGLSPDRNGTADLPEVPIFKCMEYLDLKSLKALVEAGANLDIKSEYDETFLFFFRTHSNFWWDEPEWTTYLSTLDLNINAQDIEGRTALMVHAWYGHENAVKFLLKNGANPNIRTNEGEASHQAIDFLDYDPPERLFIDSDTRNRIRTILTKAMEEYNK